MSAADRYLRATPLEVARGSIVGGGHPDPGLRTALRRSGPGAARAAFEAAMLPALERSPCIVTFSGGRDSSAVLAVAVALARRVGLPEPVAVTRLWPRYPATDETSWQELVIGHLGLADWQRVTFDETDIVGPTCAPSLLQRGPLWPPFLHSWPPIFALARGGAVISGEGGDEVLGPVRPTVLAWIRSRPRSAANPDVRRALVEAVGPDSLRLRSSRREWADFAPAWLAPTERTAMGDQVARWAATEPLPWLASIARTLGDRSHRLGGHNLDVFAGEFDLIHARPFVDPAFVRSCAGESGRWGFPGRTAAMRVMFGADLPEALLSRPDKAYTTSVALDEATRTFAAEWSGRGLTDLVDAEALRTAWSAERVPVGSAMALQTAWCADHRQTLPPGNQEWLGRREEG